METVKLTYKVLAENNPFAQKTVSATVIKSVDAVNDFENQIKGRLGDNVRFDHASKTVTIPDKFEEMKRRDA